MWKNSHLFIIVKPDLSDKSFHLDLRAGDATLRGRLVDAATDRPISEANLFVYGGLFHSFMTLPDSKGCFAFRNMPPYYTALKVEARGYPFEPDRNIWPNLRDPEKDLTLSLGEEGGTLLLKLEGDYSFFDATPMDFSVSIDKEEFSLHKFSRQGQSWTFLGHGVPPGPHDVLINGEVNGLKYKGSTKVEVLDEAISKARVFLQ